ncbi:MAG: hypothetical protein OER92_08490 [Alphaproteobacteria bacterium]|nr:hypothetical protein [Alphaproteobacteria bacterium]
MALHTTARRLRYFFAGTGLLIGLSWSSASVAQQFDVPPGFVIAPEADTATSKDWSPVTAVRPVEGPFSELSTISLRAVKGDVADPAVWLSERLTTQIGDPEAVEKVFSSPDSPFSDPVFDALKKSLPEFFAGLQNLGRIPLHFCEEPTIGYNASGEFRELFCNYNFGPVRQFVVLRLQDTGKGWYFTEIKTMNERRLRHLVAIANSFTVSN